MGKPKLPKNKIDAIREIMACFRDAEKKTLEVQSIWVGPEIWKVLGGKRNEYNGLLFNSNPICSDRKKIPIFRDDSIYGPALACSEGVSK